MGAEIRNYNEPPVREEVAKARHVSPGLLPGICWCPLCEADIISLTLSSLPPSYGREHSGGDMRGKVSRGYIHGAVRSAMDKVARSPKHERGEETPLHYEVKVVNYSLEAAAETVGEILFDAEHCRCHCRDCKADTLTLALNRFSPLYGAVRDGRWNLPADRWRLLQAEMRQSLAAAARVVSASPYHWAPSSRRSS